MSENKKKLILIDGNAIIHRAYHALPPLTNKKGELVNAVYGFSSTLLSVIKEFQPDYIAASFDLAGPTFRHEKYEDYKATREKAPDELYEQIDKVKEVARAFNIPIYEKQGFEADDIIGTISYNIEHGTWNDNKEEVETIIVTGDLDALQLVDEHTKVYTMSRGISNAVLYDEDAVRERYGISPEQLKDYKGLRGDASDNIPGVKGVGEKTATKLLQEYGTLEEAYKNIESIKGAVRDKLERDKAQAFLSKDLGTIKTNVDVDFDLEKCAADDFNRSKLVSLFQELNFFSLIKRIEGGKKEESKKENQGVKDFKYEIISEESRKDFLDDLLRQKEVAFHLESQNGKDISSVAFSWKAGRAYFVNVNEIGLSEFEEVFQSQRIKKIGYDMKSSYKLLKKKKINLEGMYFDVMLGAYVLNPGKKIEFSEKVLEELGEELKDEKGGQMSLGNLHESDLAQKICQKVDYTFKLKNIFTDKIDQISKDQNKKNNLWSVLKEIEMPLVKILAEMELAGVKINPIVFKGIGEKIETRIENLQKKIYELAGEEFNINSPGQLSEILFEKLKLPTEDIKKTKTKYSTAASELKKIKDKHEIVSKIEEYREIFKLKTTYLDVIPDLADEKKRIHTTFNQAVTATGRLSSENPNLQNIPIKTNLGKVMRTGFEADEGNVLISADYSQIDLRVMAHMSEDKKLIEAFYRGDDIHELTAMEVNKVPASQVTKKMRSAAKALNFGVIYGMGAYGFAQSADIERDEAKKFIDEYMQKFPQVAEYIKKTKEFAKNNEYVETELGRRRYVPEINSPNFQVKSGVERMAVNMPIQGMSADIMKLAMIEVATLISELYSNKDAVKMVLQIHDEIILEVREDLADEVSKKVKEIMEGVYKIKVPLVVDVARGNNWGEI